MPTPMPKKQEEPMPKKGRRRLPALSEEEVRARTRARSQAAWEAACIEFARIDQFFLELEEQLNAPTYGVPAAPKAIATLYVPRWGETREEHGCAICLDDLQPRDELRMMPCHHAFHQRCIFEWLQINRLCPVCQFALPSRDEQRLLDQQEQDQATEAAAAHANALPCPTSSPASVSISASAL